MVLELRKLNNHNPSQSKEEKKNHSKFTEHAFAATLPIVGWKVTHNLKQEEI